MSIFSDYLTRIKEKRNMTVVTMAELCNVETTVMFRWLNGERLPGKWEKIERIIEMLRLSEEEQKTLKLSYERTVFGEKKYQIFVKCMNNLRMMQYCRKRRQYTELKLESRAVTLPHFQEIRNEIEVLQYMKAVLDYQSICKRKNLYLKMYTVNPEFYTMLKLFMNSNVECNVEEVVYLEEEGSYYEYRNIEFLGQLIEMMFLKEHMTIYCAEKIDGTGESEKNWILSEEFYMEFNYDMSEGMFTRDPSTICLAMESFERLKRTYPVVGERNQHGMEYMTEKVEAGAMIRSIAFQPCLPSGLTKAILQRRICKEIPNRDMFIEMFLDRYSLERNDYQISGIFHKEGLIYFMETGVVGECPDNFYERLDICDRLELLENLIQLMKAGKIEKRILKETFFPDLQGIWIEDFSTKDLNKMTFVIQTNEIIIDENDREVTEKRIDRFEITQNRLIRTFGIFWECMYNERYTYNKEETLAILEEVLEEYRVKVN